MRSACGKVGGGERQRAGVGEGAQRLGLDAMDELAARQRIELLERRRLGARREALDGGEEEAIRAGGEVLQRRRRVGPRGEALLGEQSSAVGGRGRDQAVERATSCLRLPARVAGAQRAPEVRH